MSDKKDTTKILILGLICAIIIFGLSFAYIKYIKPRNNENKNTNTNVNTNRETDNLYHDVKYYFDNIEVFDKNIPRYTIETQTVNIRGKLIEEERIVLCKTGPCPPRKAYYLQDIDNKDYKIFLFSNELVKNLEINSVYVLKGTLEKNLRRNVTIENCNENLCKFEINLFRPQEVIK